MVVLPSGCLSMCTTQEMYWQCWLVDLSYIIAYLWVIMDGMVEGGLCCCMTRDGMWIDVRAVGMSTGGQHMSWLPKPLLSLCMCEGDAANILPLH